MDENKNKYREVKLAQALNGFMYNFGLEDFYSKLSVDRILQLKNILSDINNIITLRVTRLFVDFLLHEGIIDKYEYEEINNDVNSTSSKNNTAKSLNIPILSEDDFIETFGITDLTK